MEIAVIDIETTGFSKEFDAIVEIGICTLDLETGEIKALMNFVTNEDGITKEKIANSWIIQNSNLTIDEIRYGVNIKYINKSLQHIFDNYECTAFNRNFDIGFFEMRGFKFNKGLYPCPMLELTPIMKLPNTKMSGYKYPKVQEAWDYFFPNTDYLEQHRAYDDAYHEAKIIHELFKLKQSQLD